jgi:hypothetical protein
MKTIFKRILLLFIVSGMSAACFKVSAQDDKAARPSPPATVSQKVGGATININYGQPSVKGRKIWGELVPYNQVWRTGANEATTFETDKDIKVEGKTLPAGKYGFFTVPGENVWAIVFNKVPNQWGAFKYDEKQDYLRVNVKPKKSPKFNEKLVYNIDAKGKVAIAWENLLVSFNIK